MADVKINQLPEQTAISDTDVVIIETPTSTNKMTVGNLKELLGISSGGVVESGSNANGFWIKFADGTMICMIKHGAITSVSTAMPNGGFRSPGLPVSLPQVFVGDYFVIGVPTADTRVASVMHNPNMSTSNSISILYYNANSATNVDVASQWIVIGRWK